MTYFKISTCCLVLISLILPIICIKVIRFDDRDEYLLGKPDNTDEELLYSTFDFIKNTCANPKMKCTNNATHFVLDFSDPKKRCISSIHVFSTPDGPVNLEEENKPRSKSSIYCQVGGIGQSYCLLVFKKKERREDALVDIRGLKTCSLKERYTSGDPKKTDAYGMAYKFDKNDNWSIKREGVKQWKRSGNEIFYRKNGLMNHQIRYLSKFDKYTVTREMVVKHRAKKFTMDFSNYGQYRISFLDVYWFQESVKHKPKLPYIYYNGECLPSNKTCQLVFDADEPITYAFVKVFSNPDHNEPRLRHADLGRG
uniref:33 kDa salivary protein SP06 n=1 Tax=Phlebotomus perniciosus TaxID=13204 RepID=Q0ZS57_PHLPE|nr:33 kDa salivary protein SP06 [Phlebotomus perniciosus]